MRVRTHAVAERAGTALFGLSGGVEMERVGEVRV